MLQRYKLRLGDGTVLGVDHEGLKTWELDGKAMVQAAASRQWYPLKAFLAAERAAARRRAARPRPSGSEARPTGGPLPLVYPKPRTNGAPPQAAAPVQSAAAAEAVAFVAESSGIEALAEPPATPGDAELIPQPSVAPLVVPTAETLVAPAAEVLALSAPEALVASSAEMALATEALVGPAGEPLFELGQESMDVPAPGDEPANDLLLAEDLTATVIGDPEQDWISEDDLSALPPLDDEGDLDPQEATFSAADDAVEELVVVDPPQGSETSWGEPTVPRWEPESEVPFPSATPSASPSRPPSPRPSLQVLADDLVSARSGPATPAWRPADELPIIPLKPLDEETPAATGRVTSEEVPQGMDGPPVRSELDEALVGWFVRGISAYDALLTRWIDRLRRQPGPLSSVDPTALSSPQPADRPLDPEPLRVEAPREAERPSREPLQEAPPPIRDLPILPFANVREPDQEGDVYESEGRLSALWRSTQRIVVASGLLAGGLFAALSWETWLPKAERLGQQAFSEVDRIQQNRDHAERHRQALQEATERLPHLAPATIRLLMVNDPTGILDPPEMLRIASDAADRGAGALSSQEAGELEDLRREVLQTLRPSERERVRAYDAARARRLVFPFEGQDVLELVGRGAYALPPERRARLQELFAKAVAAGLPISPAPGSPGKP